MSEVEYDVLSFVRKMGLSISATCSCAAVVLTSSRTTLSPIFSNYISIITRRVTNPPLAYYFTFFIRYLANFSAIQLCTYSQVINMIFNEKVTRNGIPFTNMTSDVEVTNLCD